MEAAKRTVVFEGPPLRFHACLGNVASDVMGTGYLQGSIGTNNSIVVLDLLKDCGKGHPKASQQPCWHWHVFRLVQCHGTDISIM